VCPQKSAARRGSRLLPDLAIATRWRTLRERASVLKMLPIKRPIDRERRVDEEVYRLQACSSARTLVVLAYVATASPSLSSSPAREQLWALIGMHSRSSGASRRRYRPLLIGPNYKVRNARVAHRGGRMAALSSVTMYADVPYRLGISYFTVKRPETANYPA